MLEALGLEAEGLDELLAHRSQSYVPLDPKGPRRGERVPKWRVILNCQLGEVP